ncbi:MAG TPA: DUF4255 domain-containing protein [Chthoniobacteraceae bacterium]|jgi:hypothetical protein|nr:DUF4255 domain-containing protein [Chthoniobacteraceae bacterium]
MSNALAIGAATATLRDLLARGLRSEPTVGVTTLPPDLARTFNGADEEGRLNLFLYHAQPNAAWRNFSSPQQVKPGETAEPALALDLFYLVTAYEREPPGASAFAHRVLGLAMSTLHDHPLLGAEEIRNAFANSGLEEQFERVRIAPHALSLDELSKLWVMFQAEYRISVAYQVSLVLIDSNRGKKTPLPVLARGPDDRGPSAQGSLIPPFPALTDIALPKPLRSATLGTVLTLNGYHLDGTNVAVLASHRRLAADVPLTVQAGAGANQLQALIPMLPATWPAGVYTVHVSLTPPGETEPRSTNALPLALTPEIVNTAANPIAVVRHPTDVTITVDCRPAVLPAQSVSLLVGDREVPGPLRAAAATQLQFVADTSTRPLAAGDYFLRLRVDEVDSELITFAGQPLKPLFNPLLQITVP